MRITVSAIDLGMALVTQEPGEALNVLSCLALADEGGDVAVAMALRHNGSSQHRAVLPFLRTLVFHLEQVEQGRAVTDAG